MSLPPPWWRLCFHCCPLPCLFVCLSVSNITEKRLNGFLWNFQSRWGFIQVTIENIYRMFHLTPRTQGFFPFFRRNPCLLAALQKKVDRIFMKFSEKDGTDIRSNLEYLRDVTVSPLNPESIYLFPGSVFVCNMKKRMNGFSRNFYGTLGTTQ